MHFPANAGLIFLKDELTIDRYLVDTGATLSMVLCTSNSSPSGPLLKGANGLPIPNFRTNFLLPIFCKLQLRVPFSDVVAQWIKRQIASGVVPGSNPASLNLGLVAKYCNTTTGGPEYLDVGGGPASHPYSKDGSGAGLR